MDMIEPFGVPDVFVSGIGEIEDLGDGNYRVTFFTRQKFAGECTNVAVTKIVLHRDTVAECMRYIANTGGITCAKTADCPVRQLRMH